MLNLGVIIASSAFMALGLAAWQPAYAMCGPSECTAIDPLYAQGQEYEKILQNLAEQLEKTYESQRKLATWLDSNDINPGINHQAVLANNISVFEVYIKAKCSQAAAQDTVQDTAQNTNTAAPESQQAQIYIQYAQCLIPEIKARIHALQNPVDDEYIWLK